MSLSNYLFLLFPIFFFSKTVYTQEYVLKLEKVRNGKVKKTKIFKEGTLLVIRTHKGRHKGVFAIKDRNSIILNGGEIIRLEDIKKFRRPNGKLIGGVTLTVVGAVSFWGGLLAMGLEDTFSEDDDNYAEIVTFGGLAAFTVGTQLVANYNHNPKRTKNWQLSIIEQ